MTTSLPNNNLPLDQSARDFLNRLDAVEEITSEHYIWYQKHDEDEFGSIDELAAEIKASQLRSPIQLNSKSGTIRALAKEYDNYRQQAWNERRQVWKIGFDLNRFRVFLISRWRVIAQVFRVPILIMTMLLTYVLFSSRDRIAVLIHQFLIEKTRTGDYLQTMQDSPSLSFLSHISLQSLSAHFTNYVIIPAFIILVLHQLYSLFFDDKIFARAWLGYRSITKEGIYCHPNDTTSQTIIAKMPILKEPERTPVGWFNGDLQTILPALFLDGIDLKIPYIRRYIRNRSDDECCAADIAFPRDPITTNFYFDPSKPIFVFHHGLNGSSRASYIQTHVENYTKAGHTCIAMNVRGFGGTFILKRMFVGSRVSDLHCAITLAHIGAGNNTLDGLEMYTRRNPHTLRDQEPQLLNLSSVFKNGRSPMNIVDNLDRITTPVCGVGFSMGGIIMSNYCVLYGKYCGLQSAFTVCAIGDRNGHNNTQAERDWELALADALKEFITQQEPLLYIPQSDGMLGDGVVRNLDLIGLAQAKSIANFDTIFTCHVHGVGTMKEYYHDLSFAQCRKLENLKTKLFVLHPANDPVVDVDNMYPVTQVLIPEDQQDEEFKKKRPIYYRNHNNIKNLIAYIPYNGGHVGSFSSWTDRWTYISDLIYQFHMAVDGEVKISTAKNENYFSGRELGDLDGVTTPHEATPSPQYRKYSLHMIDILMRRHEKETTQDDVEVESGVDEEGKKGQSEQAIRRRPFSAIVKPREKKTRPVWVLARKNVIEAQDGNSDDEINPLSPSPSAARRSRKTLDLTPTRSKSSQRRTSIKKSPSKANRDAADDDADDADDSRPIRRVSKPRKSIQRGLERTD